VDQFWGWYSDRGRRFVRGGHTYIHTYIRIYIHTCSARARTHTERGVTSCWYPNFRSTRDPFGNTWCTSGELETLCSHVPRRRVYQQCAKVGRVTLGASAAFSFSCACPLILCDLLDFRLQSSRQNTPWTSCHGAVPNKVLSHFLRLSLSLSQPSRTSKSTATRMCR
jgi:hypothetical protein